MVAQVNVVRMAEQHGLRADEVANLAMCELAITKKYPEFFVVQDKLVYWLNMPEKPMVPRHYAIQFIEMAWNEWFKSVPVPDDQGKKAHFPCNLHGLTCLVVVISYLDDPFNFEVSKLNS